MSEESKTEEIAVSITSKQHQKLDNNLAKAQAVIRCLMNRHPIESPNDRADAIWAADDLIEEAREVIGKY